MPHASQYGWLWSCYRKIVEDLDLYVGIGWRDLLTKTNTCHLRRLVGVEPHPMRRLVGVEPLWVVKDGDEAEAMPDNPTCFIYV